MHKKETYQSIFIYPLPSPFLLSLTLFAERTFQYTNIIYIVQNQFPESTISAWIPLANSLLSLTHTHDLRWLPPPHGFFSYEQLTTRQEGHKSK